MAQTANVKVNANNIKKLEKVLEEGGYTVRYERGAFQSGYCVLEHKKVVVLNKFLNPEGRFNTLIDLIETLKIDYDLLTHASQALYDDIKAEPKK